MGPRRRPRGRGPRDPHVPTRRDRHPVRHRRRHPRAPHTASALLAREAFAAAADPAFVTPGLEPWATDRLLHNRSSWNLDATTDTSTWLKADTGTYDPRIGQSFGEVEATSRTMHESQGFGSEPEVGPLVDWFVPVLGTPLAPDDDLFVGIDTGWSRFGDTKPLGDLAKARTLLAEVPDAEWRERKTADLEQTMADCVGLWLTARAERAAVTPGGTVKIAITAVSRAQAAVVLNEVRLVPGTTTAGAALADNVPWTTEVALQLPADTPFTRPHWLAEPGTSTLDTVSDPTWRMAQEPTKSEAAEHDPLLGRLVAGKYHVVRRVARGGMSRVYLAIHQPLNRRVALR